MNSLWTEPLFLTVVGFVATTAGVLLIGTAFRSANSRVSSRLQEFVDVPTPRVEVTKRRFRFVLERLWEAASMPRLMEHLVPNDERARLRLRVRLMHAGIYGPRAPHCFFAARLLGMLLPPLCGLALGLVGACSLDWGLLYGSLAGAAGMLVPSLVLDRLKARRQHILRRSLPDFLDLFVACMESGLSLQGAIVRVTGELRHALPELATEFTILLRQVDFGHTLEVALRDLAERTDMEELRSFSTFVQQSQRYGASLGGAMRDLSDMLRSRREQRAEELAQKAAVKILIPTLLCIFPAVFVVLAGPAAIRVHQMLLEPGPERQSESQEKSSP